MRIVTFGELMLRLAPEGYGRFVQADRFTATFGGGEANVAVSLANYGIDTAFVTKLPAHEIGQAAVNSLRRYGVDTSRIVRGGDRIGVYYLEKGASQRSSKVIYDRAHSAVAEADEGEFSWREIFEGAGWFHFTGITPALGKRTAAIVRRACETAKEMGLTVSCDLNYRKKLWTKEEARRTMTELMPYVDVCIANEEDAMDVFGITAQGSDAEQGKIDGAGYQKVAARLQEMFGFRYVAITLRESLSASDNFWSGLLYDGENFYMGRRYAMHIVDRVGGGDSFGGGLIYALASGFGAQQAIDFAVAASCLKHTVEGDYNLVSAEEVLSLANGSGSGRVQR